MVSNQSIEAAKQHALHQFPRESVGIVIKTEEGDEYIPCTNISESGHETFKLPEDEYAAAEDRGEIVAIVHSHPNGTARPSIPDRLACEQSGHPWMIIALGVRGGIETNADGSPIIEYGDIGWIEPVKYEAPLIGREFYYGVFDCYTLIKDWYKRTYDYELPDVDHGKEGWWDKDSLNYDPNFSPYLDNLQANGYVEVQGALQVGDIILMQIKSHTANHAAVYLGDGIMLHHLYGRLSERVVYGGYWKDVTRKYIRHSGFKPEAKV